MILYFSGTGNSRLAATTIGGITGDEVISINDLLKNKEKSVLKSDIPFVFVCPVYAWRMPRIISSWIENTEFQGSTKAYFILTCGETIGNASAYAKNLCLKKGFDYMGMVKAVMPENYIALYPAPGEHESKAIIEKALPQIRDIALLIDKSMIFPATETTFMGRLQSTVINPIFYSLLVKDKGFHTSAACVGCGKCVELCPLNNVKLDGGKPSWNGNCTHCMACICSCPTEAIDYKKKTQGQNRYYINPK